MQQFFGFQWQPPGSAAVLFLLSSAVYFYGGYPFFAGLKAEFEKKAARHDVDIAELKPEDRILIKPGEKFPADGRVLEGATDVNESALTGESQPVIKRAGNEVMAGSINGSGAVTVTVTKMGKDSYLSQVIQLVRRAQESRSKTQNLADKAAFVLTVVAMAAGSLILAAWLILGEGFAFAVERAVTVMVTACPHALGWPFLW